MKRLRQLWKAEASDDGFTLIELLVSITITAIILAAITSAMIVFFVNGKYTMRRDDHSAGANLLSAYLDRDFASAMSSTTPAACSGQSSGTTLLQLAWTQYTVVGTDPTPVAGSDYYVNYVLTSDTSVDNPGHAARQQLERWYCSPAGGVADHETIIGDLAPASGVTTGSAASCSNGAAKVITLSPYENDTVTSYSYTGCIGSRTT
jgi:prepilin-type N-terminal cleavage/methylation domain-containing protein